MQEEENLFEEVDESLEGLASEIDGDPEDILEEEVQAVCEMDLPAQVEAIIFASDRPLKVADIQEILIDEVPEDEIAEILANLVEEYANREGGFRLYSLKGLGFQFQTDPKAGPLMERQFSRRPRPLSRAAQETLAIIAYRQPVTRAEIEFIRGVDAGSIMKGLLDRKLIKCVGRKDIAGRPMLFGTTNEFLQIFGIGSVKELPPLEAFQPEQEMVNKAMAVIEKGDEGPIDPDSFMDEGQESAETLDVDGIEEPAVLSDEVEHLKQSIATAEENIEDVLGEGAISGATAVSHSEDDDDISHDDIETEEE